MPTDKQIETWSDACDTLVEAQKRLEKVLKSNDTALEAAKADHKKALDEYEKASEELG
ncbi:MAG: hypothetical protein ACTHJQ_12040 [Rhizobiaceae bacterium]